MTTEVFLAQSEIQKREEVERQVLQFAVICADPKLLRNVSPEYMQAQDNLARAVMEWQKWADRAKVTIDPEAHIKECLSRQGVNSNIATAEAGFILRACRDLALNEEANEQRAVLTIRQGRDQTAGDITDLEIPNP